MRKALFILAIGLLAWPDGTALAQGHARDRVRAGDVQPLDRILPEIRRGHPGSFYDAQGPFPDSNGGYYYRLKWLTPDGRVIWMDTDARTGHVLDSSRFRERGDDRYNGGASDDRPGRNDDSEQQRNRFRDDEPPNDFYHDNHDRRGHWPDRDNQRNHDGRGRGDWGGGHGGGRPHHGHGGF